MIYKPILVFSCLTTINDMYGGGFDHHHRLVVRSLFLVKFLHRTEFDLSNPNLIFGSCLWVSGSVS